MKSVRVVLAVVAMLALPFGSVAAQSRGNSGKGKGQVRSAEVGTDCKDQHAAALARDQADGRSPYGLDKKCDDPVAPPVPVPPPPSGPPTGMHEAAGIVYEDVDGDGVYNVYLGDMGLAGWTIELYWDGQFVASTTSAADDMHLGMYLFPNLGDSNKLWWVCVIPQAGYVRTEPANGTACNGNGMAHTLNNPSFRTQLLTNFGEMIQ